MKDLLKVSQMLGGRGWAPGSSGNISVMIPGTRQVYIKITGKKPFVHNANGYEYPLF